MATKDCIAFINERLDAAPAPYDGNRKFKRISKRKGADGRPVREFRDDRYTFQVIGDGPFQLFLQWDEGQEHNIPAFARTAQHNPSGQGEEVKGYYQECDGTFTLVLKSFWDEHGGVDPGATDEISNMLPESFSILGDATFGHDDGDIVATGAELRAAGFFPKSLNGQKRGHGWLYAMMPEDTEELHEMPGLQSGFYLVNLEWFEQEGCMQSAHLSEEFPEMAGLFNEDMEATFLSAWDATKTAAWLEEQGFSRNKAFDDFMNPPGKQAPPSPKPGH